MFAACGLEVERAGIAVVVVGVVVVVVAMSIGVKAMLFMGNVQEGSILTTPPFGDESSRFVGLTSVLLGWSFGFTLDSVDDPR